MHPAFFIVYIMVDEWKRRPFFVVSLFLFCWRTVVNGYRFTEKGRRGVVWCRFVYAFHYYSTLNRGKTKLRHFFESSGTFCFEKRDAKNPHIWAFFGRCPFCPFFTPIFENFIGFILGYFYIYLQIKKGQKGQR